MKNGRFQHHLLPEVTELRGRDRGRRRRGRRGTGSRDGAKPPSDPGSLACLWSCKARLPREFSAGPQQASRPQGP